MLADKPFQRRDPGFILLKKIRRGRVFVKDAGLVLLNPDPDQVSADVVALGEPMQGLAAQEFPSDLTLELDAVGACLAMGFLLLKARTRGQFLLPNRPPQGEGIFGLAKALAARGLALPIWLPSP